MQLYKTTSGNFIKHNDVACRIEMNWDLLINRDDLRPYLLSCIEKSDTISPEELSSIITGHVLAPIGTQEVWAAGVTYLRSRDARMEESKEKGSADCYQRVYEADRPELFFKSQPHRFRVWVKKYISGKILCGVFLNRN